MATFLIVRHRSGPEWAPGRPLEEQSGWEAHAAYLDGLVARGDLVLGGPLADEHRVVLVAEAADEAGVRALMDADPWTGSHLDTVSIERWTLRLDTRRTGPLARQNP